MQMRGGEGREGLSEYNYLLMLMYIWPGYCDNQLESMKIRVGEGNGRDMGMGK